MISKENKIVMNLRIFAYFSEHRKTTTIVLINFVRYEIVGQSMKLIVRSERNDCLNRCEDCFRIWFGVNIRTTRTKTTKTFTMKCFTELCLEFTMSSTEWY